MVAHLFLHLNRCIQIRLEGRIADCGPFSGNQFTAVRDASSSSASRHLHYEAVKSVLLAAAAGWAAHRFNRISLPILLAVVLFYQVAGTLGEWAMVGSFFQAVQDFRIGLPGMAMQVVGGYALIKYSASL